MPRTSSPRRAFALIELMVVVLIISVLATLAIPALKRVQLRAKAAAIANDFRVFAAAFEAYAHESGGWPAESAAGVIPPGMDQRLGTSAWTRQTPLGGRYNWENNQLHFGTRYAAAITISPVGGAPVTFDASLLEVLESSFDDGSLFSGNVRLGSALSPVYIIQR